MVAPPTKGTLDHFGFGGFFTYTASPGASGADSFQVRATSSATGVSNVVTQQITIDPNANEAPDLLRHDAADRLQRASDRRSARRATTPTSTRSRWPPIGTPAHGTLTARAAC